MSTLLQTIGTEDTPVWMIYLDGSPQVVLVSWSNCTDFEAGSFLTQRTFGTQHEAQSWLDEFWAAYWALMRNK